eukprot:766605-Hanusia_phi.AAC.19
MLRLQVASSWNALIQSFLSRQCWVIRVVEQFVSRNNWNCTKVGCRNLNRRKKKSGAFYLRTMIEIYSLTRLRQVHFKKVTYLQKKILQVQIDRIHRGYELFRSSEPTTMLGIDFYLHDTQVVPQAFAGGRVTESAVWRASEWLQPAREDAPRPGGSGSLNRSGALNPSKVMVDDMLMEYLYSEKLLVHLINVQGTDFEIIASGSFALNDLVCKLGTAEVSCNSASQFLIALSSSPTVKQHKVWSSFCKRFAQICIAFNYSSSIRRLPAKIECYVHAGCQGNGGFEDLAMRFISDQVKSIIGIESGSLSFDKPKFGAVQRRVSAACSSGHVPSPHAPAVMFQVLDFPVGETNTIPIIEGAKVTHEAAAPSELLFRAPASMASSDPSPSPQIQVGTRGTMT